MGEVVLHSWEYLELLPGTDFYRLYMSPTSALAIFRKRLSELAKNFVMFMLYMEGPMTASDLDLMVNPNSRKEKEHALELLHRYHILSDTHVNSTRAYELTENFARSLRQALEGSGGPQAFGEASAHPAASSISVADLDRFARRQWEGILGYMVGSSAIPMDEEGQTISEPSPGVIQLLSAGHLIELGGTAARGYTPKITKEGFAFVLQDLNTQVWALLFLYVDMAEDTAEDAEMTRVNVLSFIFLVASLELGLAYSTERLTPTQQRILSDLEDFGVVYRPPVSPDDPTNLSPFFLPTVLATTLTSNSSTTSTSTSQFLPAQSSTESSPSPNYIVIETNFRLYAYTSSPLTISLLSLFTNLRSRHPNLVTAKMTKSSIQRAVRLGITAEQIIAYLSAHAHPIMRRNANRDSRSLTSGTETTKTTSYNTYNLSVLPATVIDAIHLWQLERDRMATTPGFLLKDFPDQSEYDATKRYADETGVLVWSNDRKRMFFVTRIEGVRTFMSDRRGK